MTSIRTIWSVALLLAATLASAEVDLADFDDETMRSMDEAVKSLDSNIALQNASAATSDLETLRHGLQWAETYFKTKGGPSNAIEWAQQGRTHAEAISQSLAASDFDAAFTSYRSLVKTCRSCHDAYKDPAL